MVIVGNLPGRKLSQILQFEGHLWKFSQQNFARSKPTYGIIILCELCSILSCVVYDLSSFPFQSFSPIPITPFQVPPVFGSNTGPDSLSLRQVYQPVPGDQATDTTTRSCPQIASLELQQRAIEYLQLSTTVTPDVLVRKCCGLYCMHVWSESDR